jgi:hypothetical protein
VRAWRAAQKMRTWIELGDYVAQREIASAAGGATQQQYEGLVERAIFVAALRADVAEKKASSKVHWSKLHAKALSIRGASASNLLAGAASAGEEKGGGSSNWTSLVSEAKALQELKRVLNFKRLGAAAAVAHTRDADEVGGSDTAEDSFRAVEAVFGAGVVPSGPPGSGVPLLRQTSTTVPLAQPASIASVGDRVLQFLQSSVLVRDVRAGILSRAERTEQRLLGLRQLHQILLHAQTFMASGLSDISVVDEARAAVLTNFSRALRPASAASREVKAVEAVGASSCAGGGEDESDAFGKHAESHYLLLLEGASEIGRREVLDSFAELAGYVGPRRRTVLTCFARRRRLLPTPLRSPR